MTLIYVSLVLLIALIGLVGFLNLYRLEKAVDNLMTDNYKSINAAARMTEAIERQDGAALVYVCVDRQKGMDLFLENHANFIRWYQVEINNVTEQGEKKLVEDINLQYEAYVKYFSELQTLYNNEGEQKASQFYDQTILPHFYKIKQALDEVTRLNEVAMFRSKEMASAKTRTSMYFLLGLSFAAVLGGFFASRYFVGRFLLPLNQLSESISRVKAGELDQHLALKANDETGRLAQEFNEMTQRLQSYEKSTLGQLMTEKNKSMAIVKSISDPLLVLDPDYRVVLINNACEEFFGIREPEVSGRHFLQAISNGELFDHIHSVNRNGMEHLEKIFLIQRGADFYFNVVVAAVKDPDSRNSGLVVVFQNVTELKELERTKTDFVATISHEFKTPLTSILMAASMLLDKGMGGLSPEQEEIVEALKEDGDRLTDLVNEMLELSRIESGGQVYRFAACSPNSILEVSVSGFLEPADRKGVRIRKELPEELPPVTADFDKISWVVNNLISNALKYSKAGDTVVVRACPGPDRVVVSVEDTGPGIAPEHIDHIFDRFFQVKGGEIEARGTGLGLYVAREIVRAHRGEIHVTSKPGEGSIFSFTLPVAQDSPALQGNPLSQDNLLSQRNSLSQDTPLSQGSPTS
jgi:PAS domain S-box-containing protein